MKKKHLPYIVLCVIGILINFLGARIALSLNLPLFLDCLGTVAAAAIGGPLPAIVVGFLTNIINSVPDITTIYYNGLNVLIALCSAVFARWGYFKKPVKLPIVIGALAIIGGFLGSILTWNLYGGGIGEGISAPLAWKIYNEVGVSMFWAQLTADILIDIADKTIIVILAALILHFLPEKILSLFQFDQEDSGIDKKHKSRNLSLRAKVLLIISAIAIIITTAVTWIFLILYDNAIIDEETKLAYGVAITASAAIDPDRVGEYMQMSVDDPEYAEIRERISSIANSSDDIAYVYVYQIQEDGCHVVFDPDTPDTPGGLPGQVIDFDESFMEYVPELLAGHEIEPLVTDDTYGWLLTVYMPLYDSQGRCTCYVGVDISMVQLAANERIFVTKVITLFLGFFILIFAFGEWAANIGIVGPINALADATAEFASESEERRAESLKRIHSLNIDSGDEVEYLYHSIESTTDEIQRYISDVNAKSEQISKMQSTLIMILADLVESRDKCTGNHVRNTATYAKLIMDKMREMGIYKEELTDDFVNDVYSAAPLHDVGKIQISDVVLNKPGKLTDEEFANMKTHTTAGGEIIDKAMGMMDEETASYLAEAKNLTLYHHERWDGRGYPTGLKGDEIPLSARIMAVADVFDALVARRSYKPGFPFEKAIDIIKEESGTHFDPKVVEAFLMCQDEAREIAATANEQSLKDY